MEINLKFSVEKKKSKSESSQVKYSELSFSELLANVKDQIEYDCFSISDQAQAEEISMIIAEIFRLPDFVEVRINKSDLPAKMVAEIFTMLTSEHVERVISNYKQAKYEIKHTKTYLRTALYNSVFELTSRIENEVRADGFIDN